MTIPTWMSRDGSDRINGERINGLFKEKYPPFFSVGDNKPIDPITSPSRRISPSMGVWTPRTSQSFRDDNGTDPWGTVDKTRFFRLPWLDITVLEKTCCQKIMKVFKLHTFYKLHLILFYTNIYKYNNIIYP